VCCALWGGGDGPLCKREQLSPPFQFSKAPEHCGTPVGPLWDLSPCRTLCGSLFRTSCGTDPLVEPYVGLRLEPPCGTNTLVERYVGPDVGPSVGLPRENVRGARRVPRGIVQNCVFWYIVGRGVTKLFKETTFTHPHSARPLTTMRPHMGLPREKRLG
jgi:hypothetical protein